MKVNKQQPSFNLKRICALCIAAYVALVILLYFLMGHQLHFRESRGDIALPVAESGTVELVQGAVLEQTFSMEVQRLQEISVQWGTYYRPNSGTATMELYNQNDGSLVLSKTFDGFAPIGPCLVPARELDPTALDISSQVNGQTRQSSNTGDMIFSVAQIIADLSRHFTLMPGDLIFTGTPQGVMQGYPADQKDWLKPGDRVSVTIQGIGTLENTFV